MCKCLLVCAAAYIGDLLLSPTGLIPWFLTEGNTYATLLHHPFLFKGKPTQCSRGSKKDFWCRCRGGFHQVKSRFDRRNSYLTKLPLVMLRLLSSLSSSLHMLVFACLAIFLLIICLCIGSMLYLDVFVTCFMMLSLRLNSCLSCEHHRNLNA